MRWQYNVKNYILSHFSRFFVFFQHWNFNIFYVSARSFTRNFYCHQFQIFTLITRRQSIKMKMFLILRKFSISKTFIILKNFVNNQDKSRQNDFNSFRKFDSFTKFNFSEFLKIDFSEIMNSFKNDKSSKSLSLQIIIFKIINISSDETSRNIQKLKTQKIIEYSILDSNDWFDTIVKKKWKSRSLSVATCI